MRRIIEVIQAAQSGRPVDVFGLTFSELTPVQLGALTANLWHHGMVHSYPEIADFLAKHGFARDSLQIVKGREDSNWWSLVNALRTRTAPKPRALDLCLSNTDSNSECDDVLCGIFLSLCFFGYYPTDSIFSLTEAFTRSGQIFDYRKDFEPLGIKLVRRYPTGGLSEKCALLLPAMIECLGNDLKIKSPFSVGRTLGFTGGTWDKLSSIDGFVFPDPGEGTLKVLRKGSCAITVTQGDAAPADRFIYQKRSETSTIECDSLIVSSIASKHAAIPVHGLVLDMRIGVDAFIADETAAERIGISICDALRPHGISVLLSAIENLEPNGSAIGNYLEIIEAMEILKGIDSGNFDIRGKRSQLNICCDFLVKMLMMVHPSIEANRIVQSIDSAIKSGQLWTAQKRFLANHGVSAKTVGALDSNPWDRMANVERMEVRSLKDGRLRRINQRALGSRVYNGFSDEARDAASSGVVLRKRRYDPVVRGEPICVIYSPGAKSIDAENFFEAVFEVR